MLAASATSCAAASDASGAFVNSSTERGRGREGNLEPDDKGDCPDDDVCAGDAEPGQNDHADAGKAAAAPDKHARQGSGRE